MTERIENVILNLDYYKGEDLYSDGAIEDTILDIVKNHKKEEYGTIIESMCKWPVLYHLSELRCNCIDWIDFGKDADVLEIGSGCGALTGCIAGKSRSLTCIELSKKRSMINAYRNSDKKNIEIFVGNFQDIADNIEKKFDVITLIGVLEYGKLYINSHDPYTDFLKKIKTLLKPDGKLIIAIENKIGMKYWAGSKEDHVGRYYESIENYPSNTGIRTFSRKELKDLLTQSGFGDNKFYYAYPDYKFASAIYTDKYLPDKGAMNNNMRNFDGERFIAFDEKKAFDTVIDSGLFPEFSNSFVVIAEEKSQENSKSEIRPEKARNEENIVFVKYSNERCPEFCIKTVITENKKGRKQVIKYPADICGVKHISEMEENCKKINKYYGDIGFRAAECHSDNNCAVFEYVNGVTFKEKLETATEDGDIQQSFRLIDGIRQKLISSKYTKDFVRTDKFDEIFGNSALPEGLKAMDFCCFDMAFDNLIINDEGINIIDYEWCFDFPVPVDYIIYRAMKLYIDTNNKYELRDTDIYAYMGYNKSLTEIFDKFEENFQKYVSRDAFSTQSIYDRYRGRNYSIADLIDNADTSEDRYTQVYVDKGEGFSEENSYRRIYKSGDVLELNIPLEYGVKACRFDPDDNSCIMIVKRIAACSEEGMYVPEYTCNGCESHGTIYFSQSDPQIIFEDIKDNTRSIQIECIVYTMDSSHIDGIAKAVYDNSELRKHIDYLTSVSDEQKINIDQQKINIDKQNKCINDQKNSIEQLTSEKNALEQKMSELAVQLDDKNAYIDDREKYIASIENSKAWKIVCKIRRILHR